MSQAVATLVRGRIDSNALKRKPTTRAGVIVTGGGNQGKTETVCAIAAAFETDWRMLHAHIHPDALAGVRDRWAPVAYAQTPVTAKPKSLCKAILNFYGAPTKGMDLPNLVAQVAASLTDHGTKVLILDDISGLRMHRADDQDVLDLLRAFMSMHVTLVLIGVDVPGSGLLHEGRPGGHLGQRLLPGLPPAQVRGLEATQTQRRFDLIELGPFRYDTTAQITAWTQHLAGIETQLRLMNAAPGMLTGATMPEYLFRRTNGVVGLLERFVEDGCGHAIAAGVERLTQTLLDGVVLNAAGNDTAAGKSPVPQRSRTSPPDRASRRSRPARARANAGAAATPPSTTTARPVKPRHDRTIWPGSAAPQPGPADRRIAARLPAPLVAPAEAAARLPGPADRPDHRRQRLPGRTASAESGPARSGRVRPGHPAGRRGGHRAHPGAAAAALSAGRGVHAADPIVSRPLAVHLRQPLLSGLPGRRRLTDPRPARRCVEEILATSRRVHLPPASGLPAPPLPCMPSAAR